MSVRAPSLPGELVVAVSDASRAIGELAGTSQGSSHPSRWVALLRRSAASWSELAVALRCAFDETELLDQVRGGKHCVEQLTSIATAARWAIAAVTAADELARAHLELVQSERLGRYAPAVLELLAEHGEVTAPFVVERLGASPTTAGSVLGRLEMLGVVEEVTGRRRGRVFRYQAMLSLFEPPDAARDGTSIGEHGLVTAGASLSDPGVWEKAVVERLFERSAAQRIIVFGSVARGDATEGSDLDVVVVTPVEGRKHDEAVSLMCAVADLPVAVDVVVVTPEEFPAEPRLPGIVRVAVREGRTYEGLHRG